METNDIKDIWKTEAVKDMKPYSEEELNEIVVKSVRKSIKTVYPGTIFRLVIITVIVYLIATLFFKKAEYGRNALRCQRFSYIICFLSVLGIFCLQNAEIYQ